MPIVKLILMATSKTNRLTPADMGCIEKAILYIDNHYIDKISAESLGMKVTLSKEKIQAGLKKKTGATLHEYIIQVRIEKAKQLLISTNDPVKAVADAAGFNNDSHFCKVFKRIMTISPVKFRLQEAE